MYGTILSKNKRYISPFILIYFVVNSYIVNKTLKRMGAQPPEIEHHRKETESLRKRRPGVYHGHTPEVSTPGKPPSSHEREVGVVASLLLPHTPPRTFWPVHETREASLHVLGEVLWHLVQFGITSSTEECDPEVLPRVTIGGGGVFVHYPTVQAERYLLLQIFTIIEGHP